MKVQSQPPVAEGVFPSGKGRERYMARGTENPFQRSPILFICTAGSLDGQQLSPTLHFSTLFLLGGPLSGDTVTPAAAPPFSSCLSTIAQGQAPVQRLSCRSPRCWNRVCDTCRGPSSAGSPGRQRKGSHFKRGSEMNSGPGPSN